MKSQKCWITFLFLFVVWKCSADRKYASFPVHLEYGKDQSAQVFRFPREIGNSDRPEALEGLPEGHDPEAHHSSNQNVSEYLVLPPNYNMYKIPWRSAADGPLQVFVDLVIYKLLDFDEINQQMVLYMDITVGWTDYKILDYRLKNSAGDMRPGKHIKDMTPAEILDRKRILSSPHVLTTIWKPNLIFENLIAIKQPYVMARPVKLKVIPEAGYIEYITRLSVAIDCGMEFQYYPADTQACEFAIRPFSYTSKLLNLKWKGVGIYLVDITLPSFDVRADDLHEKFTIDDHSYPDVVFDVLAFTIFVRRKLSYHVVQTYLASLFYIIITCLCFLLPPRMVEARIGISMTTLLTLTAMFASVRESTPITSYVKAIDTWMVYCIFFVFLTLSQFTFYTWLRGMKEDVEESKDKAKEDQSLLPEGIEMTEVDIKNSSNKPSRKNSATRLHLSKWERYEKFAYFVEKFSFPIFLSIFAVFAVVYWSWLLTSSDYFNWNVNATLNNID